MVSITVKRIVYGPLIRRKQIEEMEKNTARKVSTKSDGMIRGRCAPCSVTLDHHRYIKEVLYDTETEQLDLPTRQRTRT